MVSEEVKLLETILSDIREDIRGVRADLHSFITVANKVDAEQGAAIASLQTSVMELQRRADEASIDRSTLWSKVWQFGITGAVLAQIVMGNQWESVVK